MRPRLETLLGSAFPQSLVVGLLDAFEDMQRNLLEGRLRPSELEAGHFAEWALRICEEEAFGAHTRVGRPLGPIDQLVVKLASAPSGRDSVRLHIPRVLLGIVDVRNRRGVGHPSGDVNPNRPDAELVAIGASWVVAELVRCAAGIDIADAQQLVDQLVERRVPLVEDIDGHVKLLRPDLPLRERLLLILYHRAVPTPRATLSKSVPTVSGKRLNEELQALDREALTHLRTNGWILTRTGTAAAETIVLRESLTR